jgi:glucoamylase
MNAPGWPGIPPRWTSSAKSGVGTSLSASHVWFTISHGILDEIYYPRVDCACTRDLGLIVTDGASYFSEEKRDTTSDISRAAEGVPAYRLINSSRDGRYRISKEIVSDPLAEVVLQRIRFELAEAPAVAYRLFALLAPHLNNHGTGNTAWVGDYKGTPMLFAERGGYALALAASAPYLARSAGYVGVSDGWQQLRTAGRLVEQFDRAEDGNVALVGEIQWSAEPFVLALGLGVTCSEAAQRAKGSLLRGFDAAWSRYIDQWEAWHRASTVGWRRSASEAFDRFSAAVLRVHHSKHVRGGTIASLSIPWGTSKGDNDLGGYHLVWPRDLCETAVAFLALGAHEEARACVEFLASTQEADGHWNQNLWLDGTPYWSGVQMDETALPVLLIDLAARCGALDAEQRRDLWPMVRRAAAFLVQNGPVSAQDRWEEDPGYSPFTVAAEIAALLAAADAAEAAEQPWLGEYLRETADTWNASVEEWLYAERTELAQKHGVPGYYVRVSEPDQADASSPLHGWVPIKNRPPENSQAIAELTISPDALALVRFGLRAAHDPRMVDTVRVIDALLRVDTPHGPCWRRYNGDGYGEHDDGSAFDGVGIGRLWPLLTGERAHYELAAGRLTLALELSRTMRAFAGDSQLLPEQIWDADDIPALELIRGEASGSARPLVWAHAEYLRLQRSLADGRVFDLPPQTVARYLGGVPQLPRHEAWRFNNKIRRLAAGRTLRIETLVPVLVHWGVDGWRAAADSHSTDTGLGVHVVDLPTTELDPGQTVEFTFYWVVDSRWEGTDFRVTVV